MLQLCMLRNETLMLTTVFTCVTTIIAMEAEDKFGDSHNVPFINVFQVQ